MVNIQSPTAEIRRGKKRRKKKEEERRNSMEILWSALLHRATIINILRTHHHHCLQASTSYTSHLQCNRQQPTYYRCIISTATEIRQGKKEKEE